MEFVEVMKIKERICDYYDRTRCMECLLGKANNGKRVGCPIFITKYPEEAQKIMMKWAEEHPVKTNRQVFIEAMHEKFGDAFNPNKLQVVLEGNGCTLFNGDCDGNCKTCDQYNFWNYEYKEVEKDAIGN